MEVPAPPPPPFSAETDPREVHLVLAIDIEGMDGYCALQPHRFRLS